MENQTLILDLVEWLAGEPRPYDEVMTAWRSTCPRLTVWEDASDAGLVRVASEGTTLMVRATERGRAFLESNGRRDPSTRSG